MDESLSNQALLEQLSDTTGIITAAAPPAKEDSNFVTAPDITAPDVGDSSGNEASQLWLDGAATDLNSVKV